MVNEGGTLASPNERLSERERQILIYASKGLTDQAIANELGIRFSTVGTYWGRIRGKLGPYNRTELVAKFLRSRASIAVETLRRQNAELTEKLHDQGEAIKSLESDLSFVGQVLETAPDAILIVDSGARVRYANRQALDLFQYQAAQMIGTHISGLIPARFRSDHENLVAGYMAHPSRRVMGHAQEHTDGMASHYGTPALRADGSEVNVVISMNSSKSGDQTIVTCIIRAESEFDLEG